jgi:hypothetical protein
MTKHELIDAYASGRIGRRDFMTRLTALGVSAGAATAYAFSLAPSTALASGGDQRGFVVARAQDDGDYGGPILGFPETVGEAIEAAIAFTSALSAALQAILDAFDAEDFGFAAVDGATVLANLQEFSNQLDQQLSVLESTGSAPSSAAKSARPLAVAALAQTTATAEEALTRLAQRYAILDGYYAGAVPSLDDADARLTLMGIALINAAQGAFVRTALGQEPSPSAFIEPITLEDAEAQLDALDA